MKAFKNAWTGINISVVVTIFTLIPLIANKTVLFSFPNLFFRNLLMSPHYSNFLKKPPLSNLSSHCSESVSVTIKIIKHKTQSAKPVGLTPPWDSVCRALRLYFLQNFNSQKLAELFKAKNEYHLHQKRIAMELKYVLRNSSWKLTPQERKASSNGNFGQFQPDGDMSRLKEEKINTWSLSRPWCIFPYME